MAAGSGLGTRLAKWPLDDAGSHASTSICSAPTDTPETEKMKRVCIIGAGASGLCAARQLTALDPAPEIVVYEQSKEVGGVWVYRDEADVDQDGYSVQGRMYKNMRTNLPVQIMAFPDYPYKFSVPSFPHHSAILKYLQDYTQHFKLRQYIKFQTKAVKVLPVDSGKEWTGWQVFTEPVGEGSSEKESQVFDRVLVCNGHYFQPRLQTVQGIADYKGRLMHSYAYRDPAAFKDETVLVVGALASGRDIVLDIAGEASQVYLSHRLPRIPSPLPPNVTQVPVIETAVEDGVVLSDGRHLAVDSILLCTGYEYQFPFLDPSCGVSVVDHRICTLYKQTFNAKFPSMAFLGVYLQVLPCFQFHIQAQWVLSVWFGDKTLPTSAEMIEESDREYRSRLASGLTLRQAHLLGPMQWAHAAELADLAGASPFPHVIETVYEEVRRQRVYNLMHYKKENYTIIDAEKWEKLI